MAIQAIAVLGTGTMGSAFARRLLGAGMRVSAWDPTPASAARLADAGATAAATPEDAVRDADVVLTMVPTIASIEETMPRTLAAMRPGSIWLQMSTIGVEGTQRACALAKERRPDIVFVDAPVSGSKVPAEQGKLLILASGPTATLDALAPVFSALGQKTMRWELVGSGSRMKVVLNTWLAVLGEGIAETARLAQSLDVSLEDVSACLGSTALNAPWALAKLEKIERNAIRCRLCARACGKRSSPCARCGEPGASTPTDGPSDRRAMGHRSASRFGQSRCCRRLSRADGKHSAGSEWPPRVTLFWRSRRSRRSVR